ncbi:MAG: DUF3943 domain-containing protein [Prevotella sp.]|nr:DUF3943 domain-containing protein [Prevotella sp.]MDY2633304.1 DUF3943 domain-containing protein [Prevotella sp.]
MRKAILAGIVCLLNILLSVGQTTGETIDTIAADTVVKMPLEDFLPSLERFRLNANLDTVPFQTVKKRPWRAALEVTGINLLVHSIDRFVLREDYAKVYPRDMWRNLTHHMVWDNDNFATNLFAHPYHGSLYYASARTSGMNFFASVPFVLGGSLMWEELGETEPPAINDLFATTFGGVALGEVSYRLSDIILNRSDRGLSRVLREVVAGVICPMKTFNRLVTGEAWKVKPGGAYHDYNAIPVKIILKTGSRYLADEGALFRGEHNPFVGMAIEYGRPIDNVANKPYDYFTAEATFGLSANQPLINSVHLLGRIWGAEAIETPTMNVLFGIYQHFNFYNSKPVKDGTKETPYLISEAASIGPGLIYDFPAMGRFKKFEQSIFLDAIILGGSKSDFYNVINRDYNMGSGFSIKSFTTLEFPKIVTFRFKTDYYRLFTWKGYEKKDLVALDPLFLNAQGDRGNAELLVMEPSMSVFLAKGWCAELTASYFVRNTKYKYHDSVRTRTFELRFGVNCLF